MAVYIEALILYVVLFFSGAAAGTSLEEFSIPAEIIKIVLYCIPSIALIYLLLYNHYKYLFSRNWMDEFQVIKPGKKDILPGLITLPCLLITGFFISTISSLVSGGTAEQAAIQTPSSAAGWIILCISCIFAAYLEESFFRFYLLSKRQEMNLTGPSALFLSTVLFSICHIYEGPWGFMNAAIAGLFLGFMFLRYNSLHGIAIAHGLYNIIAFVILAAASVP